MGSPPFEHVVTDHDELRSLYRPPHQLVIDKVVDRLDDSCRGFIANSTFVLIATSDSNDRLDVSPKGGPTGFVNVIDDHRLAIPDLNGNNRLDSLHNLVERPSIALLFVVPGQGETLRVNGRGWVTTDPGVLDLFTAELRRPTTAIGVEVTEAFVHCGKSLRRGALWDPAAWPTLDGEAKPASMLIAHVGLEG